MANTHPLLMEKAEAEEEVPQQEAPVEEAAPDEEPTESPDAEEPQEEDDQIVLSRKGLFQDFKRLEQEDPRFANILHDYAARKARREHKPKIDELEARVAELNERVRKESIGRMSQDEIKERLANDPKFRQAFDAKVPNAQAVRAKSEVAQAVDDAVDTFIEAGLDPEDAVRFRQSLEGGWYDFERDANGSPVGQPLTPYKAMALFQSDMGRHLRQKAPVAAPQQQVAPKPRAVPNKALSNSGPDLTPVGGSSAGGKSMKMSEYNRLDWKQKIAMFPDEKDVAAALDSGRLVRD